MYRYLFKFIKQKIPKISSTELIALRSGTTSIDRQILEGKVKLPKLEKYNLNFFDKSHVSRLLSKFDNTPIYPNTNNNKWINYLAKNKFFSFIIDNHYGGTKISVNNLSDILTEITSVDPSLGVVTMVPNSLGPGELLSKYGTKDQKLTYLPKLADGSLIPCFGLTGPLNGSDATGKIDKAIIKQENDEIYLEANFNKRYITLAPVANLIGIAFTVEDPENILNKSGVTVALLERNHPGLKLETYHNPLNAGFPNGTVKGKVKINLDQIIGGSKNIGEGWKMLMECLSAGRGISLPATANASSKVCSYGVYNYINIREQFGLKLKNMEAIQEKFNNIILNTWIIQSSIKLTNDILDNGDSPSVLSAIMKQQTTERGRIVVNESMDILAGSAICLGKNNFVEKFYKSIPIGITVEGSNTLTRSLIIFSQGLNKSHPHIFPILESIISNDFNSFKNNFNKIIKHTLCLYFKSFSFKSNLEQQIINYATLTNFVALRGGKLKKDQMMSGDMADIFGNIYMALSVEYYHKINNSSYLLTEYIIDKLINENQKKINRIIDNMENEKYFLLHLKKKTKNLIYLDEKKIFNEIMNNKKIISEIEKNIYIKNNILEDLKNANLSQDSEKIMKVLNVGEYKI